MCDALILAEQACRSSHDFELGHTHIAPCERIYELAPPVPRNVTEWLTLLERSDTLDPLDWNWKATFRRRSWQSPQPLTTRWIADGVFQRSISCCVEADTKPRETVADRGPHLRVMFSDSTGEDQQIDPIEGGDHGRHQVS